MSSPIYMSIRETAKELAIPEYRLRRDLQKLPHAMSGKKALLNVAEVKNYYEKLTLDTVRNTAAGVWIFLDSKNPYTRNYFASSSIPDSFRYCVGFFTPNGKFIWHNCYEDWKDAEERCHYLNGGN